LLRRRGKGAKVKGILHAAVGEERRHAEILGVFPRKKAQKKKRREAGFTALSIAPRRGEV